MNKIFLDTNLLIYLATADTSKADKVSVLVKNSDFALISIQILNEFTSACFKKKLLTFAQTKKYIKEINLFFEVAKVDYQSITECFTIKEKISTLGMIRSLLQQHF